ncbi:MAG: MarR family transcriptional regulator [Pseudomonadota bacterium]
MSDLKHISDGCIMQRVRSAARHVTQVYEAALKPVNLTASQFSALVAIGRQQGVTLSTLANRIGMDRTTMIRVLAPLERRSLVRLEASKDDARAKAVFLGKGGQAILNEAIPLWNEAQDRAVETINEDNMPYFKTILEKLREI